MARPRVCSEVPSFFKGATQTVRDHPLHSFDVAKEPRTGEISADPRAVLQINVTDEPPDAGVPTSGYSGYNYRINDTLWDRASFRFLGVLFETSVGDVESVGIPITIAK